ncbi:MAG: DNA polymerase III subunit alpha [Bacteroidetes bacterium]|nr:DNA polymerase III subunit alpha [Bacteroidota bacterium]
MHLNCHTYFSFKYGTMSLPQLLAEAQSKGIKSFVLTDINNTSACLEFVREAAKYNIKPIVGIDFRQGVKQHYIGIAKNNAGFLELNQYLSAYLSEELVFQSQAPEFKNSYIIYPFNTIHPKKLRNYEYIGIKISELNKLLFSEVKNYINKLVILHPVTFRNKKDFNAHRLLRAIDNNTLLSKLPLTEQTNENEIMLSEEALYKVFEVYPELIENTQKIIDECEIIFEYGKSKNKKTYTGNVDEDESLMRKLCYQGLQYRYINPDAIIYERLEKELEAIFKMGFCSYFLINWDIVNYAQQKNYFYVGRGSGANSLAAYCLKITDVDPIDLDLYFERFINPYRVNPPDFDIDFSWKDRDDITRYIFEKYGSAHTALLATYNTFQFNSVIRELGKVFGLPKGEIDELVENKKPKQTPDNITKLIFKYSQHIHDFPSHLSIHAGGILISEQPINYYSAVSMPPKGYPLTQFSMLESEDEGLYKFDILSQRGLGHIKDTVEIVKKNKGIDIDIHNIAGFKEDEKIKRLLRTGKTMGCFYVESPAMRMLLKKLETDTYLGLVAASSIIRPGVAKSGMMREYILRARDPGRRQYIHPKIGELMHETYGIMVYQEDVIKVAHYFAGLTLAQADVMRRGMSGKFRAREEFRKAQEDFFINCKKNGYPDAITNEVWRQIESFAGYSFSKGHSASYAVESYQSLYLKAYFPKEFMVGVINNFGGFYRTENYIHEAKMSGASILAPCINKSNYLTSIIADDIYLGFIHLGELEKTAVEMLLAERERNGNFNNLENFIKRVSISIEQLRILIRIGAFRFSGKTKKELLWEIHSILGSRKKTYPKQELFEINKKKFKLPELYHHPYDDALDEIEILGFPLCSPFSLLKEIPQSKLNVQELMQHVNKSISIVGYYVTHKVTRTIKGHDMSFGTFLDSNGYFFDTTHFPNSLNDYPFKGKGCYLVKGKIVEEFGFPSIEVNYMEKLAFLNREE